METKDRVLIVCGSPERSSSASIARAAHGCTHIVAVDRGLDAAMGTGLAVDLFCGDADTVGPRGRALVESALGSDGGRPFEVERYDPHKDATDLSLALRAISERWPGAPVTITCSAGGAPDHALGVLGRLAEFKREVLIVEDAFTARILHGFEEWDICGARGRRFSCIPLSLGTVVSESGMRWELDCAEIPLLSDLGISNVVEGDRATVTCHSGVLAAWLFR